MTVLTRGPAASLFGLGALPLSLPDTEVHAASSLPVATSPEEESSYSEASQLPAPMPAREVRFEQGPDEYVQPDYSRSLAQERIDALLGEARFLDERNPRHHRLIASLWNEIIGSNDTLASIEYFAAHDALEFLALLRGHIEGIRILDIGCGSPLPYPDLQNMYNYPPTFAEMAQALGAQVTGLDIRQNAQAGYEHMVVDVSQPDWTSRLHGRTFNIISLQNILDAPNSPFLKSADKRLMLLRQTRDVLHPRGIVYMNHPVSESELQNYTQDAGLKLLSATASAAIALKED